MTDKEAAAWRRAIDHYKNLAEKRAAEGHAVQLACLVLANFCIYEESTDRGGPTEEMVQLAEHVVGDCLDSVIAGFMAEVAPPKG